MAIPAVGAIVIVRFPFSDLSQTKRRPAVVVADAGSGDWILCQVTSNSYADARAIRLTAADFSTGALQFDSYARPGKLFTAHSSLIISVAGLLHTTVSDRIRTGIVRIIQPASIP